jgi:hypothetical protein
MHRGECKGEEPPGRNTDLDACRSPSQGAKMKKTKRELKAEYKQTATPMGVYRIRNLVNDKVFVGAAQNLPGIINSNRFQLGCGSHPNKSLQAEWDAYGSEAFAFEVLDELTAAEGPGCDYRADLASLEELWLERLEPYNERGYNQKKKGDDERLKEMASCRTTIKPT